MGRLAPIRLMLLALMIGFISNASLGSEETSSSSFVPSNKYLTLRYREKDGPRQFIRVIQPNGDSSLFFVGIPGSMHKMILDPLANDEGPIPMNSEISLQFYGNIHLAISSPFVAGESVVATITIHDGPTVEFVEEGRLDREEIIKIGLPPQSDQLEAARYLIESSNPKNVCRI